MDWLLFAGLAILAFWGDRERRAAEARHNDLQARLDAIAREVGLRPRAGTPIAGDPYMTREEWEADKPHPLAPD